MRKFSEEMLKNDFMGIISKMNDEDFFVNKRGITDMKLVGILDVGVTTILFWS